MTTVSPKVAQIISITQVISESGLWRACKIGLQTDCFGAENVKGNHLENYDNKLQKK